MKRFSKIEKYHAYQESRSKVTIPNMHYKDHAPMFISLIGPPSSGKSAFFTALIQHCTQQAVAPAGPVTFKGRFRRMSMYEAANGIESVIDAIKVSDLVVLVVNVEAGLEKETLEAINMINSHGLTKLMVVLTHTSGRSLRAAKASIAKRIAQEFGFPIKFYDLEQEGIDKISRAVELTKCKPLEWKCTHPHIVVDKYRDGYAYGYVRGGPFRRHSEVHVPGHGNFTVDEIEAIDDPCDPRQRGAVLYNPMEHVGAADPESSCTEELGFEEEAFQMFGEDEARARGKEHGTCEENLANGIAHGPGVGCAAAFGTDAAGDTRAAYRMDAAAEPADVGGLNEAGGRIEALKGRLLSRFKRDPATEEDYIEKFNEEYREKEKTDLNFLQEQKLREMEIKTELDGCADLLIPGKYCRAKVGLVYDARRILILGACLLTESTNIHLQGKVIKNKWQKGDLKTNAPQFISLGWWRFQTIPLYALENRIQKYLKSSMAPLYSEAVFYGPSVPVGTSFFIYSHTGRYRVLAAGQVLDTSGVVPVRKKLKLVGYPRQIMGNNAIVQSMFSSDQEVAKFTNARVQCASGLRGILKSAIGRGGEFRATFEGAMLMSDTVFIKCYVPVVPHSFVRHAEEGATYLRSLREIKEAQGLPLYDESVSECSDEAVPATERCSAGRRAIVKQRMLQQLEQRLPFELRKPVVVKEAIELPVSPDQRAQHAELGEIMERRRIKDEEEECRREQARELRRRKKEAADEQRVEKKRKVAVESKQNAEMDGRRTKKAHKRSKHKHKK